ncbi:MAG: hypothetical protein H6739_06960 [Alphaproteobacteria bacterium]|nr:hypothetical protein [Alphaproteobacteria bacterium]
MPTRTLYAISDIHLGGAPGFQLCPPAVRRRLARFLHHLCDRAEAGETLELIVNGDFIDFLAEEPVNEDGGAFPGSAHPGGFEAFTSDPAHARAKLRRAILRTDEDALEGHQVFPAFRRFTQAGNRLTVLLGNHDLELCLPGVREALVDALTGDAPARLRFIDDGQAYRVGRCVFDHGNRADGWNQVLHDLLRRTRSALSRGETYAFEPPPGSALVVEVMNPLKQQYRFIDLLKPEEEAVIPVLVALDPYRMDKATSALGRVREYASLARRLVELRVIAERRSDSLDPLAVSGWMDTPAVGLDALQASGTLEEPEEQPSIDALLIEIAALSHPEGAEQPDILGDGLSGMRVSGALQQSARVGLARASQRHRGLRRALLALRETYGRTFDVGIEEPHYLEAAASLAGEDGRLVVFGHTHLAKQIPLAGGGLYLNTGTWCPVIRLPERLYQPSTSPGDEAQVLNALFNFIHDLEENRLEPWTQQHSTFSRVVVDPESGEWQDAQLLAWRDDDTWAPFEGYPEPL